jgi:MerR family transcriptional regulator, light-induced transcriptional regulator
MTDKPGGERGALPVVSLTVAAVARRLGVAPATLRTWDRRYGLGPSEHTAGAHRRYAPEDVERLGVMRRLILEGVTPAEAARVALATDLPGPSPPLAPVSPMAGHRWGGGSGTGATSPVLRPGGGRVVALHDGGPAARGLARAAMALDSPMSAKIIRASLDQRGVVETWERLLRPVLVGVGERWEATGQGVDVEHLLSETVVGLMRMVTLSMSEARNPRPVLLACAEEEQHSLPLHVLSGALAERRVGARVLGARVPRDALASAVRRSGPAVVFIWSQLAVTGSVDQLRELPHVRPAPAVLVGGPGWMTPDLPDGIHATHSLQDALERVVATATS